MKRFKVTGDRIIIEAESVEEIGGTEEDYPENTFWRQKEEVDPRVFYIENQKRRHVSGKAWEPMSEQLRVVWAEVKTLPGPKWNEFLDTVEEGEPIEKWPEEEEGNHHTEGILKIAYATPNRTHMIQDCADLGFNVIDCASTLDDTPDDVWKFIEKCRQAGAKALVRVDPGPYFTAVIERIKDHPSLLAVHEYDEMEGSRISVKRQKAYCEVVKKIAPNLQVFCNWDGSSEGYSWDEYFPKKDEIYSVCDVVLFCVYPWGEWEGHYDPEGWVKRERDRALPYLNPDTPLIPIMQGFYGGKWLKPDMEKQWGFWKDICNSRAIWLYRPDSAENTGFEKGELREQVKKLNEGIVKK